DQPQGLAFDSKGNLYAASSFGYVDRITPGGVVSTFASGFSIPVGLAFDGGDNLYVANNTNGTVSKVTPGGVVSTFATGFNSAQYLAFDANGNLFVPEYLSGTISMVGPGGGSATVFASGLPGAEAVAFAPAVAAVTVPEPSTLLLAGVGIAGLCGYGW